MMKKKMKRMAIDSQSVACSNHCSLVIDHEHSFDCGDCSDDRFVDDVDDYIEANETTETNCCSTSRPLQSTFSSPHNQSDLCWWL